MGHYCRQCAIALLATEWSHSGIDCVMTTSEHAFTFSPGHSFLHKWVSVIVGIRPCAWCRRHPRFNSGSAPLARSRTRVIYFGRCNRHQCRHGRIGSASNVDGTAKVSAVVSELVSVVKLTWSSVLPVFTLATALASLIGGGAAEYSWRDVPRVFTLLAATLATLLSVASVFMRRHRWPMSFCDTWRRHAKDLCVAGVDIFRSR